MSFSNFVQTDSSLDPVSFKEAGSFNARSGHGLVIPPACGVLVVSVQWPALLCQNRTYICRIPGQTKGFAYKSRVVTVVSY